MFSCQTKHHKVERYPNTYMYAVLKIACIFTYMTLAKINMGVLDSSYSHDFILFVLSRNGILYAGQLLFISPHKLLILSLLIDQPCRISREVIINMTNSNKVNMCATIECKSIASYVCINHTCYIDLFSI